MLSLQIAKAAPSIWSSPEGIYLYPDFVFTRFTSNSLKIRLIFNKSPYAFARPILPLGTIYPKSSIVLINLYPILYICNPSAQSLDHKFISTFSIASLLISVLLSSIQVNPPHIRTVFVSLIWGTNSFKKLR